MKVQITTQNIISIKTQEAVPSELDTIYNPEKTIKRIVKDNTTVRKIGKNLFETAQTECNRLSSLFGDNDTEPESFNDDCKVSKKLKRLINIDGSDKYEILEEKLTIENNSSENSLDYEIDHEIPHPRRRNAQIDLDLLTENI